jgi:hypothetical protein
LDQSSAENRIFRQNLDKIFEEIIRENKGEDPRVKGPPKHILDMLNEFEENKPVETASDVVTAELPKQSTKPPLFQRST